jgi:DNA-binding response OmpR family regulator
MTGKKILVVDDEAEISEIITMYLKREGYEVHIENEGNRVAEAVKQYKPDLIILDVLLPGMDGIEVCRELRKEHDIPILFVSCKSDDTDIILGLGIGGDDYITKPFSPSQLVARVKSNLRRQQMSVQSKKEIISEDMMEFSGLQIDLNSYTVKVNGETVALAAKEFELLVKLAQTPNRVYQTDQLFDLIWGSDSLGDYRTVMVHICNLRKKIEQNPSSPQFIHTVRGAGYKFNPESKGSLSAVK